MRTPSRIVTALAATALFLGACSSGTTEPEATTARTIETATEGSKDDVVNDRTNELATQFGLDATERECVQPFVDVIVDIYGISTIESTGGLTEGGDDLALDAYAAVGACWVEVPTENTPIGGVARLVLADGLVGDADAVCVTYALDDYANTEGVSATVDLVGEARNGNAESAVVDIVTNTCGISPWSDSASTGTELGTDARQPPAYLDPDADEDSRLVSFIEAAAALYGVDPDCIAQAASTLAFRSGLANIGPVLDDATQTGDTTDERLDDLTTAAATC